MGHRLSLNVSGCSCCRLCVDRWGACRLVQLLCAGQHCGCCLVKECFKLTVLMVEGGQC